MNAYSSKFSFLAGAAAAGLVMAFSSTSPAFANDREEPILECGTAKNSLDADAEKLVNECNDLIWAWIESPRGTGSRIGQSYIDIPHIEALDRLAALAEHKKDIKIYTLWQGLIMRLSEKAPVQAIKAARLNSYQWHAKRSVPQDSRIAVMASHHIHLLSDQLEQSDTADEDALQEALKSCLSALNFTADYAMAAHSKMRIERLMAKLAEKSPYSAASFAMGELRYRPPGTIQDLLAKLYLTYADAALRKNPTMFSNFFQGDLAPDNPGFASNKKLFETHFDMVALHSPGVAAHTAYSAIRMSDADIDFQYTAWKKLAALTLELVKSGQRLDHYSLGHFLTAAPFEYSPAVTEEWFALIHQIQRNDKGIALQALSELVQRQMKDHPDTAERAAKAYGHYARALANPRNVSNYNYLQKASEIYKPFEALIGSGAAQAEASTTLSKGFIEALTMTLDYTAQSDAQKAAEDILNLSAHGTHSSINPELFNLYKRYLVMMHAQKGTDHAIETLLILGAPDYTSYNDRRWFGDVALDVLFDIYAVESKTAAPADIETMIASVEFLHEHSRNGYSPTAEKAAETLNILRNALAEARPALQFSPVDP